MISRVYRVLGNSFYYRFTPHNTLQYYSPFVGWVGSVWLPEELKFTLVAKNVVFK